MCEMKKKQAQEKAHTRVQLNKSTQNITKKIYILANAIFRTRQNFILILASIPNTIA